MALCWPGNFHKIQFRRNPNIAESLDFEAYLRIAADALLQLRLKTSSSRYRYSVTLLKSSVAESQSKKTQNSNVVLRYISSSASCAIDNVIPVVSGKSMTSLFAQITLNMVIISFFSHESAITTIPPSINSRKSEHKLQNATIFALGIYSWDILYIPAGNYCSSGKGGLRSGPQHAHLLDEENNPRKPPCPKVSCQFWFESAWYCRIWFESGWYYGGFVKCDRTDGHGNHFTRLPLRINLEMRYSAQKHSKYSSRWHVILNKNYSSNSLRIREMQYSTYERLDVFTVLTTQSFRIIFSQMLENLHPRTSPTASFRIVLIYLLQVRNSSPLSWITRGADIKSRHSLGGGGSVGPRRVKMRKK